jgi:hypothetical protein
MSDMTCTRAAGRVSSASSTAIWVALCILFVIYAVQLRSPLRINTDASSILRLTANLTDGKPYLLDGARPVYPIGMPLTYSLMERAGIGNAIGFAALNLACICAAAYATWVICGAMGMAGARRGGVILISFSSFALLKHSVLPLTDIPYMTVSLGCLALLEVLPRQRGGAKAGDFAAAVLLLAISVLVRRVGMALFPAVLFAARPSREQIGRVDKGKLAGIFCGGAAIVVVAAIALRKSFYLPDFHFDGSAATAVKEQIRIRMIDFGELLMNLPSAKLGRFSFVVLIAGPVLTVLIGMGLWRTRRRWTPSHVYFMGYLLIMAVWPYNDARFWLPVLPLMAITVMQAIEPWESRRPMRQVVTIYLVIYALAALVAAVYTTRITLAGRRFPELYGSGSTRQAYEDAWGSPSSGPMDEGTAVIRRYGMVSAPK